MLEIDSHVSQRETLAYVGICQGRSRLSLTRKSQNAMRRLRLDSRSLAGTRITIEVLNSKDWFDGA
jgi:hypothetical protein